MSVVLRGIQMQSFSRKKRPMSQTDGASAVTLSAQRQKQQLYGYGSKRYFAFCALGGLLSCGVAHTVITPIELAKTRTQFDHIKYGSVPQAVRYTVLREGFPGLYRGWSATLVGYSLQGFFKFLLYEYFRMVSANRLESKAERWRMLIYILASAAGEFFADIALCPFEIVRITVQTSENATCMLTVMPELIKREGFWSLYKGILPLWGRQIPYTMMKFTVFEQCIEWIYMYVVRKTRNRSPKWMQLLAALVSGYIAGIFCAIVSHPADTILSNRMEDKAYGQIVVDLGFLGIWRGLAARIIMIGTLTSVQWLIYDMFKVVTRMPHPPSLKGDNLLLENP